jgi:hypothetical protein
MFFSSDREELANGALRGAQRVKEKRFAFPRLTLDQRKALRFQ